MQTGRVRTHPTHPPCLRACKRTRNQRGIVTLLVGENYVIIPDPVFVEQPYKVGTFFHFLQTHRVWLTRAQACRIIPASRALHWITKTFSVRGYCQTGANLPTERKRALKTRVSSIAAAMLKPRLDYVITLFCIINPPLAGLLDLDRPHPPRPTS